MKFPTKKCDFIIIRNGEEKTAKEWASQLVNERTPKGRVYTKSRIIKLAKQKQEDFQFKTYPDLPGEEWKVVYGCYYSDDPYDIQGFISDVKNNNNGYWEISNLNRVKYITPYAENVFSGNRLGEINGEAAITIDGVLCECSSLSFRLFRDKEYWSETMKPWHMVVNKNDDYMDFRPENLEIRVDKRFEDI